jgi:hypothetical protein
MKNRNTIGFLQRLEKILGLDGEFAAICSFVGAPAIIGTCILFSNYERDQAIEQATAVYADANHDGKISEKEKNDFYQKVLAKNDAENLGDYVYNCRGEVSNREVARWFSEYKPSR